MAPRFENPNHLDKNDFDGCSPFAHLRLVEPSGERPVIFNSLGQDLRNARHCKGLELSQISSRLKISKRFLTAIEESDVDVLPPGNAYLVGYARSYANYLGLNSTLCVEKLKIEIAEREAKRQVPISDKQIAEGWLARPFRRILSFLGLTGYEL